LGRAYLVNRRFAASIVEFCTAIEISPSNALAPYSLGAAQVFSVNAVDRLPHLEAPIRLSPRDANMGSFLVRTV
jgi:hypothetical protein